MTNSSNILIVAQNKKAFHDYEILEKTEAGIMLKGSEVKSIRSGEVNLKESYVKIFNGEVFLVGCHVKPYAFSPITSHEPTRDKKLLLNRKEIDKLIASNTIKGLTIVALKLYFKDGKAKLEIATARGKKAHDKREDLKKKESDRQLKRAMSVKGSNSR